MAYPANREAMYKSIRNVMQKYLQQFAKIDMECLRTDHFQKENLSTVYTTLEGDYRMRLAFCAEQTLLRAIAETMLEETVEDPENIAECAKEFFNVVCGFVVAEIFRETNARARFHCPLFVEGYFLPEKEKEDALLTFCYQSEQYDPVVFLHDPFIMTEK